MGSGFTRFTASRRPTDRASIAASSADRQRDAAGSRRQDATELRSAQLSGVGCKPLSGGVPRSVVASDHVFSVGGLRPMKMATVTKRRKMTLTAS
jgi:hypothetical protein